MAGNWDALVEDDYAFVMPLCHRRKFGIHYLYQPPFTAHLGVFGTHPDADRVQRFLKHVPARFLYWDIYLNWENIVVSSEYTIQLRTNHVLSLHLPYKEIESGYREHIRRNIRKAMKLRCRVRQDLTVHEAQDLYQKQDRSGKRESGEDMKKFTGLCTRMLAEGRAWVYGVENGNGQLLAAAVFFIGFGRAYYIMAANSPEGFESGASQLLLDDFIRQHSGESLLLDFEGSDVPGVAFFYSSFGAREEKYPALLLNRLPRFLRWLKKLPAE